MQLLSSPILCSILLLARSISVRAAGPVPKRDSPTSSVYVKFPTGTSMTPAVDPPFATTEEDTVREFTILAPGQDEIFVYYPDYPDYTGRHLKCQLGLKKMTDVKYLFELTNDQAVKLFHGDAYLECTEDDA